MIVFLKGADFSANNLGQIAIPLDDDIQELLGKYSKSLTQQQKLSVQTYIKTLRNSGVMDKIQGLYLPMLAGTLSEALVNCVDEGGYTPTITLGDTFEVTSYGLRHKPSAETAGSFDLRSVWNTKMNDVSIFAFAHAESDGGQQYPYPYKDGNNSIIFAKSGATASSYLFTENSRIGGTLLSTMGIVQSSCFADQASYIATNLNSFYGMSINNGVFISAVRYRTGLNYYSQDIDPTYINGVLNVDVPFTTLMGGKHYMEASHSALIVGKGMTLSEVTALRVATASLFEAITGLSESQDWN